MIQMISAKTWLPLFAIMILRVRLKLLSVSWSQLSLANTSPSHLLRYCSVKIRS